MARLGSAGRQSGESAYLRQICRADELRGMGHFDLTFEG